MEIKNQTLTVKCLTCDYPIEVPSEPQIGMVIECKGDLKTVDGKDLSACGTSYEIINTDPLEIDFLFIEK
jgi:hypothetical protein